MGGLDATVLPFSSVIDDNPVRRLDSTYFSKEGLAVEKSLRAKSSPRLSDLAESVLSFGAYALTNDFEYQETGVPFLRCVNVKNGFVSFTGCLFIDEEAHKLLSKSEVLPETVLLTMSGSVGNAAVALKNWPYPINSNQDIAKIRPKGVDPYFLSAFLSSGYGRQQIKRVPVGSVQQHIFLWMIDSILVARTGQASETRIARAVRKA